MNRTAIAVTSGFLAILAVNSVNAADLSAPRPYQKGPVYAPYFAPFTWQGFYVGFQGGYGWGDSTLSAAGIESTIHPDGALLGTTYGYNFQAGNVVIGAEGDIAYSWMLKTNDTVAPCAGCDIRNHYIATVRARLGYAMDRWLPYVTGGAAFGNVQISTPAGGVQGADKVGWTAGVGVEYALPASNWSTKLEYLYTDLGTTNCDAAHCGVSTDVTFRASIVRAGINYRF